jgi:hypothetical protein
MKKNNQMYIKCNYVITEEVLLYIYFVILDFYTFIFDLKVRDILDIKAHLNFI